MDLFTYLMAKNNQNTHKDLFSYLLGKKAGGGSGTYTTFSGTSLNISNTIKAKIKNFMLNSTELTQSGTPSPSNPVDVNVITRDNNVKVENKNVLDFDDFLNSGNATYTENNGNYIITNIGNLVSNRYVLKVNANKTYTLSCTKQEQTSTNVRVQIYKDNVFIGNAFVTGTGGNSFTFTVQEGSIYTMNLTYSTFDTNIIYKNPMLELNSTATEYVEHQEQNYPISLSSKNLLKFTLTGSVTRNGVTFTKNNDGSLTLNGTATTTFTQVFNITHQILNGTYTIKHNVLGGTTSESSYMSIQKSPSGNISDRVYGGTGSSTFDITEDTTIITASLYITSGTTFTDYNVASQLEIGTTATEYEPYYNIEYCKTEDYADQIFKNTTDSPYYNANLDLNEWYLYKKIINYNGSWRLGGTQLFDDSLIFYGVITNVVDNKVYSTHFPYYRGIYRQNYEGIDTFPNSNEIGIRVNKSIATTVNELQEWLSNNNVKILYATTTPTYIHISQEDYPVLREQLENLYNNAKSYDGTTNITQTNDDLPFNLSVDVKVANL